MRSRNSLRGGKAENGKKRWKGDYEITGDWVLLDVPRQYASCRSAVSIVQSVERHGLRNEL